MSKRPNLKSVTYLIQTFVNIGDDILIDISSEGETLLESPHRNVSELAEHCYDCGEAFIELVRDGKRIGSVYIMPYYDKEEMVVDWTVNDIIDPIMEQFLAELTD